MIERRHSTVLGLDDTKALNERRLKQLMDEHVTGIIPGIIPLIYID